MTTVRRFAATAFGVACLHLVFGAIVRISGSGMGCGPHWPKCYGYWFPPFDRSDLVIEVLHRYLATVLLLALLALVLAAWRRRGEPGVGGRGGVLRPSALALGLGLGAAVLGAVTVKYGNAPLATLAHWTVAMSLVAAVTAALIQAGGLGGTAARLEERGATAGARRGTAAAAGMALAAVVMGGLTAKAPGASVACRSFLPFCDRNPDVVQAAYLIQVTHRWLAVLLVLHLAGLFFGLRRRGAAAVVRRAAAIALALGVVQLLVAGAMIGMHLPPVLRSLHEATGVSIWIAAFALACLTRIAGDGRTAMRVAPDGGDAAAFDGPPMSGTVRAAVSAPEGARSLGLAPAVEREVLAPLGPTPTSRLHDAGHAVEAELVQFVDDLDGMVVVTETVPTVGVTTGSPVMTGMEIVEETAGGPPQVKDSSDPDDHPHRTPAHRTIFDAEDSGAHRRDRIATLGVDPFEDPDDDIGDSPDEQILSLDEQFSQLASEPYVPVSATLGAPAPVAAIAAAPPAALPAVRRPTMHHSVAVIVARGADC